MTQYTIDISRIGGWAKAFAAPVVKQLPLFVLWLVALSLGGLLDIQRLLNLEFPSIQYVLGQLRVMAYNLCLSAMVAYSLSALAHMMGKQWLRWLLALTAIGVMGVCLFVRYHYGTRLTPEIATVIRETNRAEATEYLMTYVFSSTGLPVVVAVVAAVVAFMLADYWWQRWAPAARGWHAALVLLAVPIVLLGAAKMVLSWPITDGLLQRERNHYENLGVDAITNLMICNYVMHHVDDQVPVSVASTEKVYKRPAPPLSSDSLTLVLVIGESYIKSHASVYGYHLPTTPCLQAERDAGRLTIMTDVVSPYHYTNMAMRAMLSTSNEADGDKWSRHPLVMAIFKHAGYRVSMWDNQRELMQGTTNTQGLNALMYHPRIMALCYDRLNTRNFEYDDQLVKDYALHDQPVGHELVILHLRGQHIKAERRYPHTTQWLKFTPADYNRHEPYINADVLQQIAHYDNATRYNDAVMGEIFKLFAHRQAIVVYLSDHGDEIYDYRNSIGRCDDADNPKLMVKYQNEIPMVVWCSPPFMAAHDDVVERLRQAASRPGTTDNLPQLLMGLAGISSPYYDARLDMLAPEYKCPRRMVRNRYDYDQLMAQ